MQPDGESPSSDRDRSANAPSSRPNRHTGPAPCASGHNGMDEMSALDHGMLNLPLNKRGSGSIDAQIDRYKDQQARAAKQARKSASQQLKADRIGAKAAVSAATDELIAALAAQADQTPAAVRAYLRGQAHWQPRLVIKILSGAHS